MTIYRLLSKFTCLSVVMTVILGVLSMYTNQVRASDYHDGDGNPSNDGNDGNDLNLYDAARKLILEGDTDTVQEIPYVRASFSLQRFHECIRETSLMRCTKLFLLRKIEGHRQMANSGNITRDFLEQFFDGDQQMSSLISEKYLRMPDKELNRRLVEHFQRFFKNRDIKLHFLPGLLVKVVPSKDNRLQLTFKKKAKPHNYFSGRSKHSDDVTEEVNTSEEAELEGDIKHQGIRDGGGGGGKLKHKKQPFSYKSTILQMAVPIMVMPAILLGTFLPFWLPVLKMATLMTMVMNNSAFIASLIMAARTHANAHDEPEPINYGHSSYH